LEGMVRNFPAGRLLVSKDGKVLIKALERAGAGV